MKREQIKKITKKQFKSLNTTNPRSHGSKDGKWNDFIQTNN